MTAVGKFVVAAALLAVLAWNVEWGEAAGLVGRLSWWTLAVTLAGMVCELSLSVWKWSRALNMHGLDFPYGYLFRSACAGYFFNNFLPTSVGGDAYRVYRTLPADGYRSRAVSAVLVDRVSGFGALLTLGALGAGWMLRDSAIAQVYLALYLWAGSAAFGLLLALRCGWFRSLANRLRALKAFDAVLHNMEHLKRSPTAWLAQIALSFAFQLTSVAIVYWLFAQTGPPVPFAACALIAAAAGMAAVLPVSINGIGLMEGSFVLTAVALGAGYDEALLVAVVRRLMIAFVSLLCGLVYLAEGKPIMPGAAAPPRGASGG
jgi:glycosyltransferase 2 family protein